jgi:hypothetical protein
MKVGSCGGVMNSQWGQLLGGEEPTAKNERTVSEEPIGNQTTTELSQSQAFDVLRNSRRRAAITCLREHDGAMSVNELTKCVAAREYDESPEELSSKQHKRVYTGLYQCHLDRADDLGVIDFDSGDNSVTLRDEASQLRPFLDDEESPGSARVEFSVALTVGLIVTLAGIGVGPFSAISTNLLAGLTIVALVGLALFQLY